MYFSFVLVHLTNADYLADGEGFKAAADVSWFGYGGGLKRCHTEEKLRCSLADLDLALKVKCLELASMDLEEVLPVGEPCESARVDCVGAGWICGGGSPGRGWSMVPWPHRHGVRALL